MIPGDALSGNSKAIGITCALALFKTVLYSPDKKTTMTKEDWSENHKSKSFLCSLKANNLKAGTKHKNDNLCLLGFDSNKVLDYLFLDARVRRGCI